ncbi:MAG: hypothetical protein EZS28_037606, partial [Streblomastix strix]
MKLIGVKAGSVLIKAIGKKKKVLDAIKPLGVKISETLSFFIVNQKEDQCLPVIEQLIKIVEGMLVIVTQRRDKTEEERQKEQGNEILQQIPTTAVFGSSVRRLCLDFVSQCGVSFKKKIEKYEIEIRDKQTKQRNMIEQGIEQQGEQVQKGIVEMYYQGVALLISDFIPSVYWEEDM